MKAKIFITFLLILSGLIYSIPAEGQTPQDVLSKAASKIKSAKGIEVSYSIAGNGSNVTGTLKISGTKFYVNAGGMQSWYNGKNLYTYNPRSKETTLITPTPSELAEINPLLYLNSYSSLFEPTFSSNKQPGKYIVDLKAKGRKAPVKKVTLFLNSKSYQPEKILINSLDGGMLTLTIGKCNYSVGVAASTFDYPKNKFPNVPVVDLR